MISASCWLFKKENFGGHRIFFICDPLIFTFSNY